MSLNSASLQVISASFDPTVSGSILLGTTENGSRRFYPISAVFEVTSISGSVSVATVSIGQTASAYSDILSATALTAMTAVNKMLNSGILNITAGTSVAPNTDIKLNVSVPAVATSKTVKVMLLGYYN